MFSLRFQIYNRARFEIQFLAIFERDIKGNFIDFEIVFFFQIKVLNLLLGPASISNFWQYLNRVKTGN